MIATDTVLTTGSVLLRITAIIVLTASAILASRLILKHLFWSRIRKTESELDDRILHLFESFLLIIIILLGTQAIIRLLGEYLGTYGKFTDDIFFVIYWIVGLHMSYRMISIVSNWYLSKVPLRDRGAIDKRLIYSIRNILMVTVSFFALLILLDYLEINETALTAMLAALGIGGVIVGFAAKETISNIITGIMLLIDRPFRIGDRIRIEQLDTWGDVIEIGWRSTRILTRDNRLVVIPNSIIGTDMVTNYSIPEKMFRVETDVIISYGPDIEYLRDLILDALKKEKWLMQEKPVQALLLEFTESGVKFRIRCWIENYVEIRISEDRLNTAVYKALINKKIAMPSSDLVVYFANPEDNRFVP
ncbi:MAG: mechanosensitive ion channel family protein [Methanolobus sp.]|uniref:mechanosensitive ion channel family protein n=1 Tax=Methanolobus sp. TaxID=1874737 RepID=UPI00272EF9C1|nr:mechanosensitive ion channel family protein [Methanolobus sp.]MDP2217669.1 mechanosensitive ion channel family protein [Methanolobus sp.]